MPDEVISELELCLETAFFWKCSNDMWGRIVGKDVGKIQKLAVV
jgi:hypothetical protein